MANPNPPLENILPHRIKPGEIRNPEGRNQYSARKDFEGHIERLLAGTLTAPELAVLDIPEHIRHIAETGELKRGELIAVVTVYRAMQGDKDGVSEALARLWPKVEKHEHELSSVDDESLIDQLASIRRARGGNGHDPDFVGPRPEEAH